MLGDTLKKRISLIITGIRDNVVSIILFGSSMYIGRGRDLDLIVVVENYYKDHVRDSIDLRLKVNKMLKYRVATDIHVFTIEDFRSNLKPGTFLSGLALGYEVIYDRSGGMISRLIRDLLDQLSREEYVLVNRYGKWRLNIHAKNLLRRIRKKEMNTYENENYSV